MSNKDSAQLRDDSRLLDLRDARRDAIVAGTVFPSFDDLQQGLPFRKGDFFADLQTYISTLLLSKNAVGDLRPALELALANPTADTLRAAADTTDHSGTEECRRLDLYACWLGDPVGRDRTIRRGFEDLDKNLTTAGYTLAVACGLAQYAPRRFGATPKLDRASVNRVIDRGLEHMTRAGELATRLTAAMAKADANAAADTDAAGDDSVIDRIAAMAEDRAEIVVEDGIPEHLTGNPPKQDPPGAVVVPALDPKKATSNNRDTIKTWSGIAGERLPIVQVDDLAASAARLVAKWPYAQEVIYTILGDLSHGGNIVFRPTALVGDPGSGKSALLRGIADELGLPSQSYDLGGASDSSLMGTSSRFSTAEESAVLQLIKQRKHASVCMIWDELEKASDGRHNGSALDAMLPYLVLHQAQRLRDPCLNVDVDLSFVSHFATANTLAGVPAPLRDRMRIIRMPNPGLEHIGVLAERIIDDLAKRRELDRGWYPPLAQDEIENIGKVWQQTGSLRWLERHIETTMRVRDQHLIGRA